MNGHGGGDRDDGAGWRSVGRGGDQDEQEVIAGGEPQEPEVGRRPRRPGAEQSTHQEPEIVAGDVD